MNLNLSSGAVVIAVLLTALSSRAGLWDKLHSYVSSPPPASATSSGNASAALNALSSDQLVGGLKEALSNGLQHAVGQLGHDGGFMTNLNVKIQMPDKLLLVEK